VLVGLGRRYLASGDEARAGAFFEAALGVRQIDAAAAIDLAVVRARRGDFAGALALDEGVLRREPLRLVARLNAARYRLQLSDLDAAERDFQWLRRRSPRDPVPVIGLARVAARRGDRAAAQAWLDAALALSPTNVEALTLKRELR
jgi:tetratricopeptide (TPR) repeat protein